jgi:hypothetical protein
MRAFPAPKTERKMKLAISGASFSKRDLHHEANVQRFTVLCA